MKFQLKRLISQIIFLFSANFGALGIKTGFCFPFFYCNACPTASSACPLRSMELSVYKVFNNPNNFSLKLFLYPIIILGGVGVLTGRAVCGWACPVGILVGTIPIMALNPGQYEPTSAIMLWEISIFYYALIIFILFMVLIFL